METLLCFLFFIFEFTITRCDNTVVKLWLGLGRKATSLSLLRRDQVMVTARGRPQLETSWLLVSTDKTKSFMEPPRLSVVTT